MERGKQTITPKNGKNEFDEKDTRKDGEIS